MTTEQQGAAAPMTREEWVRRWATRFREQTNLDATELAEVAANAEEDTARVAGRQPVWEYPEDAADEELSYWGDDDGE